MQQFFFIFGIASIAAMLLATAVAEGVARRGFPLPADKRRLGAIDGLRGYLALSVMLHHFFVWIAVTRLGSSWTPPSTNFINQMGAGGVALFFMTTGLVFYPRILVGLRATSWSAVFVGRLFRLAPLVTVSFAIVTAIIIMRSGPRFDLHFLTAAAKWISGYREAEIFDYPDSGRINAYVLWSLRYEWLFYLLALPVCAGAMDVARARKVATWAVPLALLIVALIFKEAAWRLRINLGFLTFLPLFAIGMLSYEFQKVDSIRSLLSRPAFAVLATFALLLGMITTNNPYSVSLPLFSFFFTCVACGNNLGGVLHARGAVVLGECSFGIYLLHGILLDVLFIDGGRLLSHFEVIALPALLPLAVLSVVLLTPITYLFVERPAMGAGKKLIRQLSGRGPLLGKRELEIAP